ncbi:pyruvate dehydrogenase (acetyl-transferring) E1 component subunit alpha [Sulfidibacter corallicola]|uniref:Pyruvate dehydrogenase E1 component subunit alpha n=1 Tax=Sulfidibacter corallicola TaxID=2818388 RepID=A0A8A4TWB3_SULCO|nr:pyruvate dehydrogenase (acetyl-transferring) E1 component subunit alpha [Sulfidibacter corallicola]QTD53647.1 pyruvate dehydrogenase (acetyl-transferring) E1 component subunit alpha [Sulfidibacter corallicola]
MIATTIPFDREKSLALYENMLLIRFFEEKAAELYTRQKIRGFLHLYIGEEAVATGIVAALEPRDGVVATYREHGHALVKGISAASIMAEMYGKQEGCSGGRGGSMHLFSAEKRFFGGHAIVGGHLPVAVGLGLAERMRGGNAVTACFFGEGAIAEGEFHESMNLAALWQVPVLFCCENNRYAMGTALERSESQTDLCAKAASYNVNVMRVDGMDVAAVYQASVEAVGYVRGQGKPMFLELNTYRFRPHSMFDPELYRDKAEVEGWKKHDPIASFGERLREQGYLDDREDRILRDKIAAEIAEAVDFAERGSWEPLERLTTNVYTEVGS